MPSRVLRHSVWVAGAALALSGSVLAFKSTRTESVTATHKRAATSESVTAQSKDWSLDAVEWSRYQNLKQGVRSHLSHPGITPFEVLGIHARTQEERRHYARAFAQFMHEDTARILAFQREYDRAIRELSADQQIVDAEQVRRRNDGPSSTLRRTDALAVVVKQDCLPCDRLTSLALKASSAVAEVEVFALNLDGESSDRLRKSLDDVHADSRARTGTPVRLLPAEPLLRSLNLTPEHVPMLLRRRSGNYERVPISVLH